MKVDERQTVPVGSGPGEVGSSDRGSTRILPAQDDLQALSKAIRRIVHVMETRSKAISRSVGLTTSQIVILQGVADLGEVTTNALSRYADLTPATVVVTLEKLEGRGLVERYRNVLDRRIVHTRLTPAGRDVLAAAPSLLPDEAAAMLAALPSDERAGLVNAVRSLADVMETTGSVMPAPTGS